MALLAAALSGWSVATIARVHRERDAGERPGGPDATRAASTPRKDAGPRRLGWRCYALQAAGLLLYIIPIWLQVYIDTRRAAQVSVDAVSESHRHWRVRSTLLFLIWTIFGGFALPFGIGWPILVTALIWYAWRVAYGAWRFWRGLPVESAARAAVG